MDRLAVALASPVALLLMEVGEVHSIGQQAPLEAFLRTEAEVEHALDLLLAPQTNRHVRSFRRERLFHSIVNSVGRSATEAVCGRVDTGRLPVVLAIDLPRYVPLRQVLHLLGVHTARLRDCFLRPVVAIVVY